VSLLVHAYFTHKAEEYGGAGRCWQAEEMEWQ
jgi:hypothetical protein